MKVKLNLSDSCLSVFLFCLLGFRVSAQQLPKVQQVSVRAPESIKIDGKTNEWDDKLQAHNLANRIFYTISNDDQNLYLTIQAQGKYGNLKILQGGLTFTINKSTGKGIKSKSIKNTAITFPAVYPLRSIPAEMLATTTNQYTWMSKDTTIKKRKIDSLIAVANRQFTDLYKEIQVAGMAGITDSLISIYNPEGIKAASRFNNQMKYTYELALPLKYLALITVNNEIKLKYNIRLNAQPTIAMPDNPGMPILGNTANASPDVLYMNFATDFSGEYTLAK